MQDHKTNVLVVDDDSGIRFTLEGIIDDEGYAVRGAEDGYQAIELAKETRCILSYQRSFLRPVLEGSATPGAPGS